MKKIKFVFIVSILLLLCGLNSISAQDKPIIRFGIIADIQYGDCETSGSRHYRNSLKKLDDCVTDLNKEQVQFTINLGDLVDRSYTDLDPIVSRLDQLNGKVYNTTGNHDYHGVTDNNVLYKKLSMPAEYYSFKKHGWLFIILNTNEVSSYSNTTETGKEQELNAMLERIKISGRNNAQAWNGGISMKQMEWLKKQLDKAEKKDENVLIFSHHPLYPEFGLTALNDKEILNLIANYTCVKAMFAGHHHSGKFGYFNQIPSITVEGMIETENQNSYGIIEIYKNKIVLNGKGRMKSRELKHY